MIKNMRVLNRFSRIKINSGLKRRNRFLQNRYGSSCWGFLGYIDLFYDQKDEPLNLEELYSRINLKLNLFSENIYRKNIASQGEKSNLLENRSFVLNKIEEQNRYLLSESKISNIYRSEKVDRVDVERLRYLLRLKENYLEKNNILNQKYYHNQINNENKFKLQKLSYEKLFSSLILKDRFNNKDIKAVRSIDNLIFNRDIFDDYMIEEFHNKSQLMKQKFVHEKKSIFSKNNIEYMSLFFRNEIIKNYHENYKSGVLNQTNNIIQKKLYDMQYHINHVLKNRRFNKSYEQLITNKKISNNFNSQIEEKKNLYDYNRLINKWNRFYSENRENNVLNSITDRRQVNNLRYENANEIYHTNYVTKLNEYIENNSEEIEYINWNINKLKRYERYDYKKNAEIQFLQSRIEEKFSALNELRYSINSYRKIQEDKKYLSLINPRTDISDFKSIVLNESKPIKYNVIQKIQETLFWRSQKNIEVKKFKHYLINRKNINNRKNVVEKNFKNDSFVNKFIVSRSNFLDKYLENRFIKSIGILKRDKTIWKSNHRKETSNYYHVRRVQNTDFINENYEKIIFSSIDKSVGKKTKQFVLKNIRYQVEEALDFRRNQKTYLSNSEEKNIYSDFLGNIVNRNVSSTKRAYYKKNFKELKNYKSIIGVEALNLSDSNTSMLSNIFSNVDNKKYSIFDKLKINLNEYLKNHYAKNYRHNNVTTHIHDLRFKNIYRSNKNQLHRLIIEKAVQSIKFSEKTQVDSFNHKSENTWNREKTFTNFTFHQSKDETQNYLNAINENISNRKLINKMDFSRHENSINRIQNHIAKAYEKVLNQSQELHKRNIVSSKNIHLSDNKSNTAHTDNHVVFGINSFKEVLFRLSENKKSFKLALNNNFVKEILNNKNVQYLIDQKRMRYGYTKYAEINTRKDIKKFINLSILKFQAKVNELARLNFMNFYGMSKSISEEIKRSSSMVSNWNFNTIKRANYFDKTINYDENSISNRFDYKNNNTALIEQLNNIREIIQRHKTTKKIINERSYSSIFKQLYESKKLENLSKNLRIQDYNNNKFLTETINKNKQSSRVFKNQISENIGERVREIREIRNIKLKINKHNQRLNVFELIKNDIHEDSRRFSIKNLTNINSLSNEENYENLSRKINNIVQKNYSKNHRFNLKNDYHSSKKFDILKMFIGHIDGINKAYQNSEFFTRGEMNSVGKYSIDKRIVNELVDNGKIFNFRSSRLINRTSIINRDEVLHKNVQKNKETFNFFSKQLKKISELKSVFNRKNYVQSFRVVSNHNNKEFISKQKINAHIVNVLNENVPKFTQNNILRTNKKLGMNLIHNKFDYKEIDLSGNEMSVMSNLLHKVSNSSEINNDFNSSQNKLSKNTVLNLISNIFRGRKNVGRRNKLSRNSFNQKNIWSNMSENLFYSNNSLEIGDEYIEKINRLNKYIGDYYDKTRMEKIQSNNINKILRAGVHNNRKDYYSQIRNMKLSFKKLNNYGNNFSNDTFIWDKKEIISNDDSRNNYDFSTDITYKEGEKKLSKSEIINMLNDKEKNIRKEINYLINNNLKKEENNINITRLSTQILKDMEKKIRNERRRKGMI